MSHYRQFMSGLPPLHTIGDLADATHLSGGLIVKLSKYADKFYRRVPIPKRAGGTRTLQCPSAPLRALQRWLLRNILDRLAVSEAATGFRADRGIAQNLHPHLDNHYVLCMDMEDFFGTIRYAQVWQVFHSIGYEGIVAGALTRLCTYDGYLPQGAPTSPALSNLVCIRLDKRLSALCGRNNITYTRYADDLAFSARSPGRLVQVQRTVVRIVEDEDFTVNPRKTRYAGPRRQRRITGLVLRGDSFGISRQQKRQVRAMAHRYHTQDMADADRGRLRHQLDGWLAFLRDVDPARAQQLQVYEARLRAEDEVR